MKITGVSCPDCGAGGGNDRPCWCHVCDDKVMMLPSVNGRIIGNWHEYYLANKTPVPKHAGCYINRSTRT